MLFPGEDAEEMHAPAKVRELLRHNDPEPTEVDGVRARVYTHHSRIAERFVAGRVALAGDAAHLMPPWAGQGLNTGLRDAFNLAWKLAAIVRGAAAPSLLASYEEERRAHAKAMIDLSTTLGRILSPTSRLTARARDAFFRAATIAPGARRWILEMRFKPQPAYSSGVFLPDGTRSRGRQPAVGRMFVQPQVETGTGACVRLDEVLGLGFAVVGFECDPAGHLDAAGTAALGDLGAAVLRVVESRAGDVHRLKPDAWPGTTVVEDVENLLRPWFHRHGVNVVILRPDRYVAALCDARDLSGALAALRSRLGHGVDA
jgi:3-(3-hydroxy-phenyl)propionate hydroxylase